MPSARKLRSTVSNWWWCVSTKPGMTMRPVASISAALPAARFGPTARIFLPSTSTSAWGFALVGHAGVHRHHRAAADDVAPARAARVRGQAAGVRRGRARRKQIETRSGYSGRRRSFEKMAPRREVILWSSLSAQDAHVVLPYASSGMTRYWLILPFVRLGVKARPVAAGDLLELNEIR